MAAIITNKFRILNASTMMKSIDGVDPINRLYLFIGRHLPWPNNDTPDQPVDCDSASNDAWTNMLAMKAITSTNISHGIVKRNWAYGTYYDIWRHDYGNTGVLGKTLSGGTSTPTNLSEANYYVVTPNGNVYICIDNKLGSPSYENPENFGAGINYEVFETPDSYKWKYISTVGGPEYAAFSTLEFHPVKFIEDAPSPNDDYEQQYLSQQAAATKGGAIFHVVVNSGGTSGILGSPGITIPSDNIKGDGQGFACVATTDVSGIIDKIIVTNPGSGYTYCTITGVPGIGGGPSLVPIITPKAGLGANPVNDLNAFYTLINVRLEYDEGLGDFTTANNFRQIGIIVNPETYGGGALTDTTADATYKLTMDLAETYSYTIDSVIKNNTLGTMATVVDWTPPAGAVKGVLRVVMNKPSDSSLYTYAAGFYTGNTIEVIGTGHTAVIDTVAAAPTEVDPYSGTIIYYENRKAIQRDITQIEDIHLAFEF